MPYITSVERIGIRQGLLEGIELGLELKFGSEGLGVLPKISRIQDVEQWCCLTRYLGSYAVLVKLKDR